jgi:hypothetical protein
LILVYTDKPSLETIQHIIPYTGDILVSEDLDILVVPEERETGFRTGWNKGAEPYRIILIILTIRGHQD